MRPLKKAYHKCKSEPSYTLGFEKPLQSCKVLNFIISRNTNIIMVGPTLFASSKLPLKSMIIAKFVKCWHWHSVAVSDVDTSRHPSELQEFWATSQKTHVGSKSENIRKFNYSQHISQLVSLQQFTCFLPDMFFFLSIVHK